MGIVHKPSFIAMDDDPDDYRPSSTWAPTVDPDGQASLTVVHERIGVGDRIPRHWHDVDKVVLYEGGTARVHLDGTDYDVSAGATVFIPAGAVHGSINTGTTSVEIRAVFPAVHVRIDSVERNPAPGTEGDPPRAVMYDMRTGDVTAHGLTELPDGY